MNCITRTCANVSKLLVILCNSSSAPCPSVRWGLFIIKRIQCSIVFSPRLQSFAGFNLRFSLEALHCFLLSLLLWPDGSITFFSRKSMNRQSKGDSSHWVMPDALVYSRVLRDIYQQKFNGLGEEFPESYFWWVVMVKRHFGL